MGKRVKLSIYLAKDNCINDCDILKAEVLKEKVRSGSNYTLYCCNIDEHPTEWSTFFKSFKELNPVVSSTRVVLIKRLKLEGKTRLFALTFGQASSFFNDDVFEERFGIKILLNTLDSNQIKQISKRSVGGNQKSAKEQLPRGSDIFEFGFDIQRDLIKAIAGRNDKDESVLGKRMLYGSNMISFATDYEFENIDGLLMLLYKRYIDNKYIKKFSWIDYIHEETSKTKKEKLDEELINQINKKNSNIWFAAPNIIEWGETLGFSIEGDRGVIYDDVDIEKVVASFKDELISADRLKSKEIRLLSTLDNIVIDKWTAYKCIVANIQLNNEEYCICDGKWYKIDVDFVKEINDKYNQINICDVPFIDFNHSNEDEYNKELTKSLPQSIETHTKLIYLNGRGGIEPCDVYYNKRIIHIKRTGGSSNLSHLFMQAQNSIYIWGTKEGRKKLKSKVPELGLNNSIVNNEYEIVAAIVGEECCGRPKIPFFSKITACNVSELIELAGFSFSLKSIRNIRPKNGHKQQDKKSKLNKIQVEK